MVIVFNCEGKIENMTVLNVGSKIESEENKTRSVRDISIWIDAYDDVFSDFDPRLFQNEPFPMIFFPK